MNTKNDKFLIFLKNIDVSASPFDAKKGSKTNSKTNPTHKKNMFQREPYSCLDLKNDSLPKIPAHWDYVTNDI